MVMYTVQSIASIAWSLVMQPISSIAAAVKMAAGLRQCGIHTNNAPESQVLLDITVLP